VFLDRTPDLESQEEEVTPGNCEQPLKLKPEKVTVKWPSEFGTYIFSTYHR